MDSPRAGTAKETINRLPASRGADAKPTRGLYDEVMSDKVFKRLSGFINESCGIKLPEAKKTMLEGRIRKRLRVLNIDCFEDYCDHIFNSGGSGQELIHMIDVVTTNKTDFFREPDHFEYLANIVLPDLAGRNRYGAGEKLNVWSAGCSTGEEPYTLAMILNESYARNPGLEFSILATDISTAVLEKAQKGIYEEQKADPIPMALRKKYLLRSRDKGKGLIRIAPQLRAQVKFRRLNFMEDQYGMQKSVGVIFCRNVIIYFDRPTQEQILNRLSGCLVRGGYLFIGHSESLHAMDLPLAQTAATVYRKL
ncbi:MAG: protein-glutamate O-methyltransferase [Syntrophobacteraceae bacterium]|nr:protein-glutamate O-methyltransferase [Syntrophobacteraceae bacterium]